jgi:CDGSH-type Zn-finger protein
VRPATREELLDGLARGSELEHDLACVYLYAGYSLKTDLHEGGLTVDELSAVRDWKRRLAHVAVEEMLHLAQVSNIATAIGGVAHFARTNFPLPPETFPFGIDLSLQPFSRAIIERLVCYEMPDEGVLPPAQHAEYAAMRQRTLGRPDWTESVGDFYRSIEDGIRGISPERLFIGEPIAQANPRYLDLPKDLIQVVDADSAARAIEMIVAQGESPTQNHPDAHFVVFDGIRREYEALYERAAADRRTFDPVRPMTASPELVSDPLSRELSELFDRAYALMLLMLARFFAHGGENEDELRLLARGTLRLMASVLRPLGEALAKAPAGPAFPGRTAGPRFGVTRNIHLLAHKRAAWIVFLERLYDLSSRLTVLAEETTLPNEVPEAAAALESIAEHLTPFIPPSFAVDIRSCAEARSAQPSIRPEVDGPYIVRNLPRLTNSKGETLEVRPILALCRCGGSNIKPYCDGTHARIGFSSDKDPARTPDRLDRYVGADIIVLDNRGTCCHFGNCTDHLPAVFHHEGEPFVTPDGASAAAIIDIVRQCPSGALGFERNGDPYQGEERAAEIYVAENASYYVRGSIALDGAPANAGASREHYALCRCGRSKNKPFCDGTHWYVAFRDEDN